MQLIDDALRDFNPDLPVRFIGIQELQSFPSLSDQMFANTSLTWLRESPGQEPSESWRVPPAPDRPAGGVRYRDAIILDHNNEFADLQNLTDFPIHADQDNLDNFIAKILAVSAAQDTDGDRLPDHWERDHFGDLNATPTTPLDDGRPALLAFATGGATTPLTLTGRSRPFTLSFRSLLGFIADPLVYRFETSTDGGRTWDPFDADDWTLTGGETAYDGTATRINYLTYNPSTNPGPDTLVRMVVDISAPPAP